MELINNQSEQKSRAVVSVQTPLDGQQQWAATMTFDQKGPKAVSHLCWNRTVWLDTV